MANACNLIQTVSTAWTMAGIAGPAVVALVQSALSLPVMLFAFAAGTLADHAGRRSVTLMACGLMTVAAALLAVANAFALISPALLLAACFVFGCGTALFNPTLVTAVGDHLPSEMLPEGIANIGIAYNLARCIGPAAGGLLLSLVGATASYGVNAIAALAMLVIVASTMRRQPAAPATRYADALKGAVRLVTASLPLRTVLRRTVLFTAATSSIWALIPVVVRQQFGGGAATYGLLMSALGIGAILFALRMRLLRERLGYERMVVIFSLVGATGLIALPHLPNAVSALGAMLMLGASYTGVMTVWSTVAQLSVPRSLAGRAVGAFHTASFGGMAIGSWGWGYAVEIVDLRGALVISGCLVAATSICGRWWPVPLPAPENKAIPDPDVYQS